MMITFQIAVQFMQRNSVHYLRQLSQMIKPAIYLPGEVILKKGDFGDSLCFLQRGYIEVSETFLAERYNIYRLVINSI